jgi:hypothetical protein
MKYQSKKNPEVIASLTQQDEKYKTVIMVYLTGPDTGKAVSITEATLKRWWRKYDGDVDTSASTQPKVQPAETSPLDVLNIDYEKVNEPYPEPKEKKYIKKPDSVIEYENRKRKDYGKDLPTFEEMQNDFQTILLKLNKGYFYLKDGTSTKDTSTIWRHASKVQVYANEATWTKLTAAGFKSEKNNDKARPFGFKITDREQYSKMVKALVED